MTGKRWVNIGVEWTDGFIQDHYDDKDLFTITEVVDKLNNQQEKINELETDVSFYKKAYEDYHEELHMAHLELINAKSKGYQLSDSFTKYMLKCNEKEITRIKELIK